MPIQKLPQQYIEANGHTCIHYVFKGLSKNAKPIYVPAESFTANTSRELREWVDKKMQECGPMELKNQQAILSLMQKEQNNNG